MTHKMESFKDKDFGSISIVDVLIFFSIFVILSIFFYTNYYKVIENSRLKIAHTNVLETLPGALETSLIDVGEYPSTTQGLDALISAPFGTEDKWKGPYITTGIVDPWGSDYQYVYPSVHEGVIFDIWSLGPDKVQSSDDIVNWDVPAEEK